MDRGEFIKEIMSLYPHTFDVNNEAQYKGWIKRYQQIPKTWDFEKLMIIFSRKWTSTREAPPPSWFMQFREDVRPIEKKTIYENVEMTPAQKEQTDKMMKDFRTKLYEIANKHKI